jgi:RNA polymerase sigma-70 factor (ECF subfamily)
LTVAYEAARPDKGVVAGEELESALASLYATGAAAHPTLTVPDEVFAAHLGRCGATVTDTAAHAGDLFLACAALNRAPGAVERLRRHVGPYVEKQGRLGQPDSFLDEVRQRLWDALLVGATGAPRLATYSGAGPLERWVGVAAQRIALMMLRREGIEARAQAVVAAQEQLVLADPEIAAIKTEYRDAFQRAIQAALGVLGPRDTIIFRMHLVENLSLESIGKVYGVHQTTVTRWLAAARERVIDDVKRRLRDELNLPPGEFDSLVGLLISQIALSLSQALGATNRPDDVA